MTLADLFLASVLVLLLACAFSLRGILVELRKQTEIAMQRHDHVIKHYFPGHPGTTEDE